MLTPRVPPWYKDDDEVEGSFSHFPLQNIFKPNSEYTDGYAKIAKCWLAKFDPAPPKESPPRDKSDENNYEDFVIFPEEVNIFPGVVFYMCADLCWQKRIPKRTVLLASFLTKNGNSKRKTMSACMENSGRLVILW